MKNVDGFPVIEPSDYPDTVYRALRESVGFWREHMPESEAWQWQHTAHNSWETLVDDHGLMIEDPKLREELARHRDSELYMTPDQLELALVAYGCNILDHKTEEPAGEVDRINALLRGIDEIKKLDA